MDCQFLTVCIWTGARAYSSAMLFHGPLLVDWCRRLTEVQSASGNMPWLSEQEQACPLTCHGAAVYGGARIRERQTTSAL